MVPPKTHPGNMAVAGGPRPGLEDIPSKPLASDAPFAAAAMDGVVAVVVVLCGREDGLVKSARRHPSPPPAACTNQPWARKSGSAASHAQCGAPVAAAQAS